MSTRDFYDGLAGTYHALYPDWPGEVIRQGTSLHRLVTRWHEGPLVIADVACGIGTQMIGLARYGHRVVGMDISGRAVERAARECVEAGVAVSVAVADMRNLPLADGCVDVVVCADNALPHLVTDADALTAFSEMRRVLKPRGTVLITTRDYELTVVQRPTSTLPQVYQSDHERIVTFQLWTWREGTDIYDLEHFQVLERDATLAIHCREATYRAYTRGILSELAQRAGLNDVAWHRPAETDFFQPIMTARKR